MSKEYPIHRFEPYPEGVQSSVCVRCAAARDDDRAHRPLGQVVMPTRPGMVPRAATTAEEEHAALLRRIRKGHDEVEFVPIGGADARMREGES